MYDAFISYSRANLPLVQALKQGLEERGLRVFLDINGLRGGQDWPPQLGNALQKSRTMVLCWSAEAEASEWVQAEINHALMTRKRVLPWLLDRRDLPPMLRQTQGFKRTDSAALVYEVAKERIRYRSRKAATLLAVATILAMALWFSWRLWTQRTLAFSGHVVDEQGPVAGAIVEAAGVHGETGAGGDFVLLITRQPSGGGLRVIVRKAGYKSREINTQSDVPDLGVVLEKARQ